MVTTTILNKRQLAFLLIFCVVLLGCGSEPEAVPFAIVIETETNRTLEHTLGTTEIPKEPLRVVALGEESLLLDLLDTGIKPIMTTVNVPGVVALVTPEEVEGIDQFSSTGNISLETVTTYSPDLIIASVFFADRAGYDQLNSIAPTVTVGGSLYQPYIDTMTIFGKQAKAEANVKTLEEQIEAEATRLATAGTSASIGTVYAGESIALFFEDRSGPPTMLNQLGVTLLPTEESRGNLRIRFGRAYISKERLDLISEERLILLQNSSIDGEMEALEEVSQDPLWQRLPVVEAENITVLDRLGYPGFRGQQALINDLLAALE
ncbi:MAG: ABC transporter substrate-binding protein [Chloroflexota bacterium]